MSTSAPQASPSRVQTVNSLVVPRLRRIAGLFATIPPFTWLVYDFAVAALSMSWAYSHTPEAWEAFNLPRHLAWGSASLIFGTSVAITSHVFGLHDRTVRRTVTGLITQSLIAVLVAIVALVTISSIFFYQDVGRNILGLAAIGTTSALVLCRAFAWHFATRHPECIGLLGDRAFVNKAQAFLEATKRPIRLCPVVLDEKETHVVSLSSLPDWAALMQMDEIVFHGDPTPEIRDALFRCLDTGVRVISYTAHLEKNHECVAVNELSESWFLSNDIRALHPHYMILKRASDIFISALGLLLSAPLMLVAVISIKLESPGPAFYKQTRIGLRNRPFSIYKLRSMRLDAEKGGAQWASKNDNRILRVGKILRKTRMDEVPQFWNILKGDMAFIGPRPERPEFVDSLAEAIPYYRQRHLVKPGLTGWAQINVDYGASVDDAREKLRYDLYYVKEASLKFDLHVCIRTIGAIMRGAR